MKPAYTFLKKSKGKGVLAFMYLSPSDLDKILQQKTPSMKTIRSSPMGLLRGVKKDFQEHLLQYLLASAFLLGVLGGTLLVEYCSPETMAILQSLLGTYIEERQLMSFTQIMVATFFSFASSLLLLFLCGFCTIAQLLILLVLLVKGLGYGFSVGALYQQYGTQGIFYVLLLIFPIMILGTLLLIWAGKSSLKLSLSLLKTTWSSGEGDRQKIQNYCIRYLFFLIFCLLVAILDGILYISFSGFALARLQ